MADKRIEVPAVNWGSCVLDLKKATVDVAVGWNGWYRVVSLDLNAARTMERGLRAHLDGMENLQPGETRREIGFRTGDALAWHPWPDALEVGVEVPKDSTLMGTDEIGPLLYVPATGCAYSLDAAIAAGFARIVE